MIRKITNTPRDYAWGSKDLISDYFGIEPTGKPMAEIWFGTHPGSPTRLSGSDQTLLELRGEPLSFLFKILAAGQPLSLQAHPTREQALEGFARENAAGIALDSELRNYKDDQHKPEMVVALTDFRALTGFREATETEVLFAKLQLHASEALASQIQLWRDLLAESIEKLFSYLLGQRGKNLLLIEDLLVAASNARASAVEFEGNLELLPELQRLYPGDPGVVISLMLNFVELREFEALQLGAGNIHAYLSGLSLEVMAASDNVLRGGLTPKHIDAQELVKVLNFTGGQVPTLQARKVANGVYEYARAVADYQLYRFELSGQNLLADLNLPSDSIAICTSGEVTIYDSQGETLTIKRGEAAYLADARLFSLSGNGVIFLATN